MSLIIGIVLVLFALLWFSRSILLIPLPHWFIALAYKFTAADVQKKGKKEIPKTSHYNII